MLDNLEIVEYCNRKAGIALERNGKKVYHLKRGEVFLFDGMKILTFGGAASTDKYLRKEGSTWWSREIPNSEDYRNLTDNLTRNNYTVDYVITHTAPK